MSKLRIHKKQIKIACLGDSLSNGRISYNWIKQLSEELKDKNVHFYNFGKDGDLAFNALKRINKVIAVRPDHVFILLGTNDVNATLSELNEIMYIKSKKLPQKPNVSWYIECMEKIVNQLKNNTSAKISLISMPILGENLDHVANRRVQKYNLEIKDLCKKHKLGYIDLNKKIVKFLKDNPHKESPLPPKGFGLMYQAILRKYLLLQDWNTISQKHKLILTTDTIHLNITSGKILAELVKKEILKNH